LTENNGVYANYANNANFANVLVGHWLTGARAAACGDARSVQRLFQTFLSRE